MCVYVCVTALQPGRVIRVNQVTFCPGQPGLTRFIKYSGLTRIWNRITCVIIMTSHCDDVLDDVSISCQYILKRVIVDGVEAPRKVTRDSSMGSSGLYGNSLGSLLRSQTI